MYKQFKKVNLSLETQTFGKETTRIYPVSILKHREQCLSITMIMLDLAPV